MSPTLGGGLAPTLSFITSTPVQTALAQMILGASYTASTNALQTALFTGTIDPSNPDTISAAYTLDLSLAGGILVGADSIPSANLALDGQNAIYVNDLVLNSQVVAADNTNSTVINTNPLATLVADTGAGANLLLGLTGTNTFTTGIAGQDIVFLNGTTNTLVSNGSDAVLVGGASTITAAATGNVNVGVTADVPLHFINGSLTGVDSITGANGGLIVEAGYGATSITAAGNESIFLDTSSGNTTLNGSNQGNDTLVFVKNLDSATGMVTVNNFVATDSVFVHGYTGYSFAAVAGNPAGSMLQPSDGSRVTFTNVSVAQLEQTVKLG